jgi:NADH-quinone oxidoreductase subunit M
VTGLLTAIVLWPAAVAVILLFLAIGAGASGRQAAGRWVARLGALLELGLAAAAVGPTLHARGYALVQSATWVPYLGIGYHVGIDGVSLVLVLLTALLTLVSLFTVVPAERELVHLSLLLFAEAASMGIFLSLDLVLFYLFWEAVLIPAYLLLLGWGGPGRRPAAMKFLVMSLAGSLFMLVGMTGLASAAANVLGSFTFDLPTLLALHVRLQGIGGALAFVAFALAFAVKSALFPVHEWQPDAYVEAPTDTTILLAGILSKAGIYGFLRFLIPLFPDLSTRYAWVFMCLGVAGLLYGAFIALAERDMKRVLAYSSLSHMGLLTAAVFALNAAGTEGAVLQMVSHGLVVAAMFALVGMVEVRLGTRDLRELGGFMTRAPILAGLGMVAAMAALGLPGLSSFAAEFLQLTGLFARSAALGVVSTLGVILAAAYVLRLYQTAWHGPLRGRAQGEGRLDLALGDYVALAPTLAAVVLLGLVPGLAVRQAASALSHVSTSAAAHALLPTAPAIHGEGRP